MRFALPSLLRDPHFRRGAADIFAFAPGVAAWGLVTGVAMVQSGLGIELSLLMTLLVYAGSSQLAALPLLAAGAPVWIIWASAACVNLRFVIFSAQWRPHIGHLSRGRRVALAYVLGDINLIVFRQHWRTDRHEPGQVRYLLGGASNWFVWQAGTIVGIFGASFLPASWGLGFAGTLSMLGLTYGLLVDRTAKLAALVAGTAAIAAYSLPLKLNILVAISAAAACTLLLRGHQRRSDLQKAGT